MPLMNLRHGHPTGNRWGTFYIIDDLLDAFILAADRIEEVQGEAFNVGGGPANTVSLLELLEWLDERCNPPIPQISAIGVPAISRSISVIFVS